MRKRAKAKKRGDVFVVSDDEEHMKDFFYRSKKRKDRGKTITKSFEPVTHQIFYSWSSVPGRSKHYALR